MTNRLNPLEAVITAESNHLRELVSLGFTQYTQEELIRDRLSRGQSPMKPHDVWSEGSEVRCRQDRKRAG